MTQPRTAAGGPAESRHGTIMSPEDSPGGTPADVQRWLAFERTHLANERTYAAWLRTGLSVAAVGVAVTHLLPEEVRAPLLSFILGAGFVIAGVVLIVIGAWRYGRTHRALSNAGQRAWLVAPAVVYVVSFLLVALLLTVLAVV